MRNKLWETVSLLCSAERTMTFECNTATHLPRVNDFRMEDLCFLLMATHFNVTMNELRMEHLYFAFHFQNNRELDFGLLVAKNSINSCIRYDYIGCRPV